MNRPDFIEKIKNIDQEIESVSTQINDLATRQQRFLGYRQCLVDMKENKNNATSKNTSSS